MRVLFMGTPEFALPSLEVLLAEHELAGVVTRPDRPRGRGRLVVPPPVKDWAEARGVPVEQPATLRSAQSHELVARYRPELIVVVAYGLILPTEVLSVPERGCINVHASLLPRHRGAAPVAWAILAGDDTSGVTTMLMDEGMDTGAILLQRSEPVGERATAGDLSDRLANLGAPLLSETIRQWEAGSLEPSAQDDEAATSAPRLQKEDGEIDWRQPAAVIDRQVRALQPWPVAYTDWEGDRLQVWWVEPRGEIAERGPPGMVVRSDDELWVTCGEGEILDITELQRAGGRRQPAIDFLRGRPVPVGTQVGRRREPE